MKNIDLNPGGFIGAVLAGGIAAAFLFTNGDPQSAVKGKVKLCVICLAGGAFAGNFLWGLIFKKPDASVGDSSSDE